MKYTAFTVLALGLLAAPAVVAAQDNEESANVWIRVKEARGPFGQTLTAWADPAFDIPEFNLDVRVASADAQCDYLSDETIFSDDGYVKLVGTCEAMEGIGISMIEQVRLTFTEGFQQRPLRCTVGQASAELPADTRLYACNFRRTGSVREGG